MNKNKKTVQNIFISPMCRCVAEPYPDDWWPSQEFIDEYFKELYAPKEKAGNRRHDSRRILAARHCHFSDKRRKVLLKIFAGIAAFVCGIGVAYWLIGVIAIVKEAMK